jgi:LPS O-antigen subunit length determinant protein (WzzB/FepE family)
MGADEPDRNLDPAFCATSVAVANHGWERPGFQQLQPGPPGVEKTPGEFPLLDLLIVVFRRGQLLLRTTLASAGLALIFVLLLPNRFTATTTILPPQQSPTLASALIGQLGALGPLSTLAQKDMGLKNPNDLYVGMLRSRTAEEALIRRFDLVRIYRDKTMAEAREDLEHASHILVGKEGFVSISVEDKDRSLAPRIANGYVAELRQLTQDLAVTEAAQRRLFFERQLERAKDHLADAEQALKETEQKTGLIQLDGQAKSIIDAVVKLRAAIAAKEVELRAMRLFSTEQNPDLRLAEEQLSGMRVQLARMEQQSDRPGKGAAAAAPIEDRAQDEAAPHAEGVKTNNVPAGSVPAGSVPEAGLQYVRKLREVKYSETLFEMLAKQYEAARLDESKAAAVIQVVDPAVEPDRKSSPRRSLIVLGMVALGFLLTVGYVIAAAAWAQMRLDPRIESRVRTLAGLLGRSARTAG